MLERRGIISGYEGSKPRQVLISISELPAILAGGSAAAPGPEVLEGEDRSDTQSELEPVET
jgi:S-DNA-T family DNA segregation ATPase FtsK/SpoIIIE